MQNNKIHKTEKGETNTHQNPRKKSQNGGKIHGDLVQ